jgi:hypothetical protein
MARQAKRGSIEVEQIISDLLFAFSAKQKEAHNKFVDNTHKVYRDEIKQFKAEVEMNTYADCIEIVQTIGKEYNVSDTSRTKEESGKEKDNEGEVEGGSS